MNLEEALSEFIETGNLSIPGISRLIQEIERLQAKLEKRNKFIGNAGFFYLGTDENKDLMASIKEELWLPMKDAPLNQEIACKGTYEWDEGSLPWDQSKRFNATGWQPLPKPPQAKEGEA